MLLKFLKLINRQIYLYGNVDVARENLALHAAKAPARGRSENRGCVVEALDRAVDPRLELGVDRARNRAGQVDLEVVSLAAREPRVGVDVDRVQERGRLSRCEQRILTLQPALGLLSPERVRSGANRVGVSERLGALTAAAAAIAVGSESRKTWNLRRINPDLHHPPLAPAVGALELQRGARDRAPVPDQDEESTKGVGGAVCTGTDRRRS